MTYTELKAIVTRAWKLMREREAAGNLWEFPTHEVGRQNAGAVVDTEVFLTEFEVGGKQVRLYAYRSVWNQPHRYFRSMRYTQRTAQLGFTYTIDGLPNNACYMGQPPVLRALCEVFGVPDETKPRKLMNATTEALAGVLVSLFGHDTHLIYQVEQFRDGDMGRDAMEYQIRNCVEGWQPKYFPQIDLDKVNWQQLVSHYKRRTARC